MISYRDNAAEHRFEWDEGGFLSFADYAERGGVRAILHVETPAEGRGQGYAAKLMNAIIADARERGLKLQPLCSYAVAHFRRHPQAHDVLA
ncbi:MAG: GNAT family N-acetyltransferase [Hyphomonadaceae bacterium]|nr:GNAT family N-acetyltransferase [Hyphomonadaceae bacterium]